MISSAVAVALRRRNQYRHDRRIWKAFHKARRVYPGVVGEVLAEEILALDNLRWLVGTESRPARLLRLIETMDDVP